MKKETRVGEASGPANEKKVMLLEALQQALDNAPPPPSGNDIHNFTLPAVELDHDGFMGVTRTRVTLEVRTGPLK